MAIRAIVGILPFKSINNFSLLLSIAFYNLPYPPVKTLGQ